MNESNSLVDFQKAFLSSLSAGKEMKASRVGMLINNQIYQIEASRVDSIHPVPVVTPLPNSHPFVLGIGQLHGRTLLVLDLALALNATRSTRALLFAMKGVDVGIVAPLAAEEDFQRLPVFPIESAGHRDFLAMCAPAAHA